MTACQQTECYQHESWYEVELKQQIADLKTKNNELSMAAADRIAELQAEIASLKDGEEYRLMQDRIQRLVDGGNKLREDKRELFTALEYAVRFVRDADMDYIEAHILKHKEGL
jgi:FtsZ-binding cell division protein ZapB